MKTYRLVLQGVNINQLSLSTVAFVFLCSPLVHGKNGFVTATKLGTTNQFFVAATKNFAAATKRFVDRTKHFVVVTKYFCYPYFNKLFCWYNKTFYTVFNRHSKDEQHINS